MPQGGQHVRWQDQPGRLLERGNRALLLTLGLLTVVAWALTIYHMWTAHAPLGTAHAATGDHGGMATATLHGVMDLAAMGMVGAGWSLAAFATFVVTWTVMMAAMMFPAAAPCSSSTGRLPAIV